MATRDEVNTFLRTVGIRSGLKQRRLWKRDYHSLQGLAEDGLLYADIWPTIEGLKDEDYSEGPVPNLSGDGEVWMFAPSVREDSLYVKLRLVDDPPCVECISFHTAQRPMTRPLSVQRP